MLTRLGRDETFLYVVEISLDEGSSSVDVDDTSVDEGGTSVDVDETSAYVEETSVNVMIFLWICMRLWSM
jgi:hypothetical protein